MISEKSSLSSPDEEQPPLQVPAAAQSAQLNGEKETEVDPNIVDWDEHDKDNPKEWPFARKIFITVQLALLAVAASLGSSIISPAERVFGPEMGVSKEVSVLAVSLYVVGFAFGPVLWAPISEIWGRRVSMLPAMFIMALFSIGTATSKNATSIFVTRFFSGIFGSAPVSNVTAALSDIWRPQHRGTAVAFYGLAVVGGPTLGPTIGAALTNSRLGWRWTEYIEAIFVFAVVFLSYFGLPELYSPVLLKWKARRLRAETGNNDLYHPHERLKLDFKSILTKQLARPLRFLFTEPIVTCIALYASFVYALLYLTLEVFPYVFADIRGWGPVVSTLPFLALFVGVIFAVGINIGNQPYYIRKCEAADGKPVPEARLPPMAIGSVCFTTGLWLFGWTASPDHHWIIPVIAAAFIGCGFSVTFQQCINFLVDSYGLYAASATAANTFLRSLLGAAFPLVANPMFHNLGVAHAMSILGSLAVLALPMPFVFMKYGKKLRMMSKFAPSDR
ncbi:major facilitator superfamily domain-containing protein [Xylogone sp. PMI_703]|nr:major facilitator superfamily domain-containing protein [Xylogone sp. PMI_703]